MDTEALWREYQATKQGGTITAMPRSSANLKAQQKGLEAAASVTEKLRAEKKDADATRAETSDKIRGSLDALDINIENLNTQGGYSPLYDNEELLFGVLPGVKPTVQFLRSQGMADLPIVGNVGQSLTNRESMKSNVGALAAQLKGVIRGKGEGVWTDADQEYLMQMLPSGVGYETDKNISKSLRSGTLLNNIEDYRESAAWNQGKEQEIDTQNWNTGIEQIIDTPPTVTKQFKDAIAKKNKGGWGIVE